MKPIALFKKTSSSRSLFGASSNGGAKPGKKGLLVIPGLQKKPSPGDRTKSASPMKPGWQKQKSDVSITEEDKEDGTPKITISNLKPRDNPIVGLITSDSDSDISSDESNEGKVLQIILLVKIGKEKPTPIHLKVMRPLGKSISETKEMSSEKIPTITLEPPEDSKKQGKILIFLILEDDDTDLQRKIMEKETSTESTQDDEVNSEGILIIFTMYI